MSVSKKFNLTKEQLNDRLGSIKISYTNFMEAKLQKTISQNIRSERKAQRLTQQEVAEAAGITVNYYATIERGESMPSLLTFTKIIKALGVKSSKILTL